MDYFISDLHLGHQRVLEFERSEFKTINEHDNFIINILKKLKETDTLYILGDVGFNINLLKEIKAKKILIKGNHDKFGINKYNEVFDKIYNYPIYYRNNILLSHYPHPVENHILNVHGHLHASKLNLNNYINANIVVRNYSLLTEKDLIKLASKLPQAKRKYLDEWYANFYQFDPKRKDMNLVVVDENNNIKLEETKKLLNK